MSGPQAVPATSKLEIRVFGPFGVWRDGKAIPDDAWGRRKTQTLLKVLLTDPGAVFGQDRLAECLFGDGVSSGSLENLYGRVSELRRVLEPNLAHGHASRLVQRRGNGYRFDPEGPCWLDAHELPRCVVAAQSLARRGERAEAIEAFKKALALYRGQFLESDLYEEWTLFARQEWNERHAALASEAAELCAQAGHLADAVACCRVAFVREPWRESLLQQLLGYCDAMGRRGDAAEFYRMGEHALRAMSGAGPSGETQSLYERMLRVTSDAAPLRLDRTRIAVLPFVCIGRRALDEDFAAGVTEEMIVSLSKLPYLRVIAQTSSLAYRDTRKTAAQIGRELRAGVILEGSVRRAGDSLRVTVQLVDAETDTHLWAAEYDRHPGDTFRAQSDIARRVANALQLFFRSGGRSDDRADP